MIRGSVRRAARGGVLLVAWLVACVRPEQVRSDEARRSPPSTEGSAPPPGAIEETTAPAVPVEPPRVLTDPGSGIRMVWSGAAMRTAVADRNLVVLEPDGRHLSAIDWRDGEAQWRIEQPSSESVELYGLGDRVMLHDRNRAVVIEAARGRVLGRHEAPRSGRDPYTHEVQRARGACAWVGPCGIQPFDCKDGRPLGAYLASSEIHLYGTSDDPSEHSTSCSPDPRLLGRYEDVVVVMADLPLPAPSRESTASLLGIDVATGQPRWQRSLPSGESPAGLTDDGGCWILDEQSPRIEVLECEDGAMRWERGIGPGTLEVQAVRDVLVVGRQHGGRWRLSAYATTHGRPGWSARFARNQRPVLPEGRVWDAQRTGSRRVYALVDPTQNGVIGDLVAGRDERLWLDPNGGFVLIGRELREIDAEGRITRQRPFTGTRVHTVTEGHILTQDGETIEIYDREQLRERARLEGRLSIETEDGLPGDRLLLRRHGDDGIALVLGLEPPSRAGGRR